ncbi:MAG: hypothetical protein A3F95_03105 [Candidatus Nealsonbacteria bacterium RIFCSPLOWO2_12_FULL_39_31]|uniref:Response regulatory domain-containing protein n=2 Tax=Candidatus Nealsoniibacteriota TaxID=1817911 RepID=A0A1G2EL48_9BACT|nr:MAG: Response regulator receiver protein [Parcubacteria group bacterium GW2011_GWA2_38_27]KKQ96985.1 MAG: Response regulator receiver protein [Parcubacteria group bacterium GW2011_GWC2_39_11]OGZ19173.1 MAG: hypothetical protein A2626_00095 [Candidatus Nealsonbacteria bacterium RIFCSPHIGHO2_01_FULL_38_55]OGZ22174.1 MAG: hypothetical protein A3C48_00345 [Candidatus Nealsonbacteria bacterium RIFCSPHIGHO2_02_FULL_38_75]OGZ22684.1 MAG: hypothetical protein A3E18_01190 [Candidatus Nealsonbacteria 
MKKILFIEDESALQKAFGDILSESGYEMKSAMDGETGLRLVGTEKPDLILLDITLPKLNGFEVLEKLKKNPETKKIPVIILTNLEKIEDVDKAIGLGAMTYLVKAQYKLEDVIEKIKNAIKEK